MKERTLTVKADKVAIREKLYDDTPIIEWVKKGDRVKVECSIFSPGPISHEYYRITASNGERGYIRKDAF